MLLVSYFTIGDMNSATTHVTLHTCQSSLEVQNAVIRVKHGFKILEARHTTYYRSRLSCAYMGYRLCFCVAIDKENKTLHLHFTPAKCSASIARNPLGALQFRSNLLAPACVLVERPLRSVCKRPAMVKRDDSVVSSSGCSNGTHKRLLQDSSGYAQEHAKKKVRISTRTEYTYAPYHDGYQWRKYGQKMIRGNTYPRCYYRCTYHQDHGCPATKHVDQTNSQDPPLFRVLYTNEHTCISTDASSIHIQQMADASLRKAEMEELPSLTHCRVGHEVIKEEKDAIVSSLLNVMSGGDVATSGVMYDMQENTTSLLSSKYSNLSSMVPRSSHEAPVLLPASDERKMDFVEPLESHWFEPLDLGWFMC